MRILEQTGAAGSESEMFSEDATVERRRAGQERQRATSYETQPHFRSSSSMCPEQLV